MLLLLIQCVLVLIIIACAVLLIAKSQLAIPIIVKLCGLYTHCRLIYKRAIGVFDIGSRNIEEDELTPFAIILVTPHEIHNMACLMGALNAFTWDTFCAQSEILEQTCLQVLYKVPDDGGSAVEICDVISGKGAGIIPIRRKKDLMPYSVITADWDSAEVRDQDGAVVADILDMKSEILKYRGFNGTYCATNTNEVIGSDWIIPLAEFKGKGYSVRITDVLGDELVLQGSTSS